MFGFIKRLLGRKVPVRVSVESSRSNEEPLFFVTPSVPTLSRASSPAFLLRDEIVDARTRIAGYRFSARCVAPPHQPDAETIREVLVANKVSAFAQNRLALIPVRLQDGLKVDFLPLIGKHTVFLLDSPGHPDRLTHWLDLAASIRRAGARIALAYSDVPRDGELSGAYADVVLLDFSAYDLSGFERAVAALISEKPKPELIVENIGSWPERRYCVSLGADYCMGAYTTCIDEAQGVGEISQSRLVLIEMVNLLRRDADQSEIANVAKRDPGVSLKLVTMANSPIMGLSQAVNGVDQACLMLGREQLYRWLSIAMFRAGAASPRDEVLLELALARARFLELIGRHRIGKAACDELFLVGLLSLLDVLLGVPMPRIIEQLKLSPTINSLLLDSEGPLGRYLRLAIVVEKGRVEQVVYLAEQLDIPLADIERASCAALAWAEDAVRLSQ